MSKFIKAAPAVIIIVALALILMLGRNILDSKLPALGGNYYKDFKSDAELEYKYSQKGEFDVDNYTLEEPTATGGAVNVWYPRNTDGRKVPMIIVANPSKLPATNYKPFFERLASWGFVVVGNEDQQSGNGKSASEALEAMKGLVETHPLRDVIDYDRIGIVGYSQGGSGALAAATEYDNGKEYKAIFTGSAVEPKLSESMGWIYDTSKIQASYFMTAGTLPTASGLRMREIYTAVSPTPPRMCLKKGWRPLREAAQRWPWLRERQPSPMLFRPLLQTEVTSWRKRLFTAAHTTF